MADTPTLNRAANQIKTVGAARLSLDDVRALAAEVGAWPTANYADIAALAGALLDASFFYCGCTDSGPKSDARHEFLFTADSRARVKVKRGAAARKERA